MRTEKKPITPQVFVSVAANAEGNSISLTCTYDGVETDNCGFVLTKDGEVVKKQKAESTGEGSFSQKFDDLDYDTEYGYYAWIVNGEEEIHSNTGTVRTEQKPVIAPTIKEVSFEADENILTLRCTYEGDGVDGWGFYFNGGKMGAEVITDGAFSLVVKDLEYDTDYEFQAYITTGQTEVKSDAVIARTGKMASIPIPDEAFKAYIMSRYDIDKNGKLSMEEAEKIIKLDFNTYDLKIKSLEGIEYFTNLEYLKAVGYDDSRRGELKNISLSKNTKLLTLICYFNKLETCDLRNCKLIKYIDFSSNMLSNMTEDGAYIDLGENPALEYLDCHSNPSMNLFLGDNKALRYLDCSNTIGESCFTGCPALEYLDCSNCGNLYNGLNISGLKNLTTLKCEGCLGYNEFDASGCENLVFDPSIFTDNEFLRIKLRGCNKLTSLDICYGGKFTYYIDVTDCKNLKSVKCNGRDVVELYVGGCTALTDIECYENFLHELDVSSCKKLSLKAWPQSTNFDKLWIGSGEYHYFNESGQEINPADYGTEVIVKE